MTDQTQSKQATRNRRNAEKSTGPRSASGKARASQNAIQHGLSRRKADGVSTQSPTQAGTEAEGAYTRFLEAEDVARQVMLEFAPFLDGPWPSAWSETTDEAAVRTAMVKLQRLERYRRARLIRWTKASHAEHSELVSGRVMARPGLL